jgi:hypothetical protein
LPIVTDDLESLLNFVSINFFMAENSKKPLLELQKSGCDFLGKQNGKRRFKCKNCGIYFTSE